MIGRPNNRFVFRRVEQDGGNPGGEVGGPRPIPGQQIRHGAVRWRSNDR